MKGWAWVWLGVLVALGWAPAVLVSYLVAVALAVSVEWNGPAVFRVAYYSILVACLLLLVQVRTFFGLKGPERAWFTGAGGGALVLVWVAAHIAIRIMTGGL